MANCVIDIERVNLYDTTSAIYALNLDICFADDLYSALLVEKAYDVTWVANLDI